MIAKIKLKIRKLRNWFSRSYWAIRLFRLSKSENAATTPGLVLIQIDGLSFKQYQRGLREKNLPFIRSLAKKQKYKDYEHYSGMPSNTPAVQGEFFYGVKGCVPAFSFVDRQSSETFVMFDPKPAQEIERRLNQSNEPLLRGGSSYSNIFTGGAEESHFCAANGKWDRIFQIFNPLTWFLIFIFHLNIFIRTLILLLIEFVIGIYDFVRGLLSGKKIIFEFQMILGRALICVLLRELVVIGGKIDIARGLPVIHLNLIGYDEQAHWRGPSSKFAHWSLKGIDDAVRRIWKEAKSSERGNYDVWIYSDHGQEDAIPYAVEYGRSIEEAVASIFGELADSKISKSKIHFSHAKQVVHASPKVIAVGMGPLVHIYPAAALSTEEKEHVISELLVTAKVPVVLIPKEAGKVEARTLTGTFILPKEAKEILGDNHPFLKEAASDLVALCHHPSAGKIIISGWCQGMKLITFAPETGCHAGYGPEETRGFALLPSDVRLNLGGRTYLRPLDLRQAALRHLERIAVIESKSSSVKGDLNYVDV